MASAEAVIRGRGEPPDMPWQLEHIWHWFGDLCSGRQSTNALGYPDIEAWSRLTCTMVRPFEVALIKRLDQMWLMVMAEKIKNPDKPGTVKGSDPQAVKAALRGAAR